MKDYNMWEDLKFNNLGTVSEVSSSSMGFAPLMKKVLSEKSGCVHEFVERGYIHEKYKYSDFVNIINKTGASKIYEYDNKNYIHAVFANDESVFETELTSESYLTIQGVSLNKEAVKSIKDFTEGKFSPPVKSGHVFAIIYQNNKLALSSLGDAGIKLNKDNYSSKVVEDYNYVIEDLKSSSPSGRISILEGEPGTGKTHIIRAFLTEVPNGMFVLVSPDMVTSLSGPELLPLIMTHKQNYGHSGPIIFLLEDADKCLVARQGDNINSIQALLNLGDGILGSMLDIRIIATTNAKKLEMEAAILRPGRLSRRIEVGALSPEEAQKAYKNLLPKGNIPEFLKKNSKYTLAEIYGEARKNGWKAEEKVNKKSSYEEEW